METVIECCVGNIDSKTRSTLEELDVTVEEKRCLQRCGKCYKSALLVCNGTPYTARSHESLLAQLRKKEGLK